MLKNYFKIALRTLKRSKAYTLINVLGLALGIACAILVFALVKYHLSFDTFHSKLDRIYLIGTGNGGNVPSPLGKAFRNDYDFAEKVARVYGRDNWLISVPSYEGWQKFEEDCAFAEPDFFDILDFPLIQGDKNTALTEPNTAIITERLAKKFFGDQNPVGQVIRIENKSDFRITGILRNLPANTDRRQEIYLSYANLGDYDIQLASDDDGWSRLDGGMSCFILLKNNVLPSEVDKVFPALARKYYNEQDARKRQFKLKHFSDVHLNPGLGGYVEKKYLWALSLIGLFLIITACVNFINLATAQALSRSREIGVRKVLGSHRRQLFWQFIAETAVIAGLAMVLAFILAQLTLPSINQFFDTQLHVNPFRDVYLLVFLPVLMLIVIFFSGSYPGLVLAGFQPVLAMKGKLSQKHVGGFSLRRGLIVIQFAISQLLIIGMIVIANQMRYARQADMGFQKDAVVVFPERNKEKISMLRSQLAQIAGVEKVTFCSEAPIGPNIAITVMRFDSRAEDEDFGIAWKAGDDQYLSTFDLQLMAGRNFIRPPTADTLMEFLVNETTVRKLNIPSNQDVIGKKVTINGMDGTIVGVFNDFHNNSFHKAIDPLCIANIDWYGKFAVKINAANLHPALRAIEMIWKEAFPNHIYKHDFMDEQIARFYEQDYIFLRLIRAFAGIAIIIGCLGLYGLISFMVARKTKEVGVRKVLGASVQSIVWLFGKEFTRLLLVAFVIAAPIAWWVMNGWLENFVYRIDIGAGIFVLAILITLMVAVLTVGYRSVKAALMNPVKSLRSE